MFNFSMPAAPAAPMYAAPPAAPTVASEIINEYKGLCAAFGVPSGVPEQGPGGTAVAPLTAAQARVSSNFKVNAALLVSCLLYLGFADAAKVLCGYSRTTQTTPAVKR